MRLRLYRSLGLALVLAALLALPFAGSASACGYYTSCSYSYSNPSYYTYSNPSYYSYAPSTSYGGYGSISSSTGLPRTNYVSGYTRSNGTYVNPYYRSCSYCSYP